MSGWATLIDEANGFFEGLAANNRKDWFEDRKAWYVDHVRKPAEMLADIAGGEIGRVTGHPQGAKVFRVYRDVRFSKDKTPYNPWLHVIWQDAGAKDDRLRPAHFFESAPPSSDEAARLNLAAGIMADGGEPLTRLRAFLAEWGGLVEDALEECREAVGAELSGWGPAPLKRVPKPYEADHPHGDLLKRKALIVEAPLGEGWREGDDLIGAIRRTAEGLLPLTRLIRERL